MKRLKTVERSEEDGENASVETGVDGSQEDGAEESPLQQTSSGGSGGCQTAESNPNGLAWMLVLLAICYSFSRRFRTSPSCSRNATRNSIPSDSTF